MQRSIITETTENIIQSRKPQIAVASWYSPVQRYWQMYLYTYLEKKRSRSPRQPDKWKYWFSMPLTCEIPFHLHHFTQSDYIVHQGASVHPQFIVAIAVSLCRTNLFSNSRTKNIIFIILNCNNRNEHLWIISRSWK